MKPAPIVFDGRYIQDRYHGIGRYAYFVLREVALRAPGVRVFVLRDPGLQDTRFDWSELSKLPNISIREIAAPAFGSREQLEVPRALARLKGAIYHTPYFALPWLAPSPSLITVHDCIFEHDARYMPKRWARLYYSLLMRYSLYRARRVFVPSRATARDLLRFYRVPARKLTITTEAAADSFRPVHDPELLKKVRAAYSLPHRFILAVGARRPHKNFVRLVEAVARLKDLEGATLVLVGEADQRFNDDAAEAAKRLDLPVRFLGKVPERDLPVLYNLATVFACPSLIEGFGLPVLEAMACGTPVVCSAIPVFRETAGDAAMQVPPQSTSEWAIALERVLSDPTFRTHLSDAGRRRAAQFSWGRAGDAVLSAYSELGIMSRTRQ